MAGLQNGTQWRDTDGVPMQCHGGMILEHGGVFYWYGENKDGGTQQMPGCSRVDFIGISCYSSRDLIHWKNEGIVLSPSDKPGHDLHPSGVVERPRVLYHEGRREFVMWLHIDRADYTRAASGLAVSSSPTGPFTYLGTRSPADRADARDFTLAVDRSGCAWLIHSSDWNRTLQFSQLTEDYRDFTGHYTRALIDQEREAPAVTWKDGKYYLVTSGCTGWAPNSALYAVSSHMASGRKLVDDPCTGPHCRQTFFGQGTCLFTAAGQLFWVVDHWKPDALGSSGYSILPVAIEGDFMEIPWRDEFVSPLT